VKSRQISWVIVCVMALGMIASVFLSQIDAAAAVGSDPVQLEDSYSFVFLPLLFNDYVPLSERLCRFGVGGSQSIGSYDVNALRLGWYLDWSATLAPASPGGIGFMPMIRLSQTGPDSYSYAPSEDRVLQVTAAQPGATWLIGNEPDRRWYQDDLEPYVYARAYHDLYHLIKTADPTAKIAAGGIVQPTPLRLQYLDMVLDSYVGAYDVKMPVDVWNIHAFILREQVGSWGADIPRGIDATEGELYEIDDNGNVEIFKEGIERFRGWMADNGYRDRPLIITEFGIQMPPDYGFLPERVRGFINDTFDYLLAATDIATGYPADNHRLVQKWAWYSLTDADHNGWLFDSATKQRTVHGDSFAAYTADVPATVNLTPVALGVDEIYTEAGHAVSATLKAAVANNGNMTSEPASVRFYAGDPQQSGQLIAEETAWGLDGCADTATVTAVWADASAGDHTIYVVIDSQNHIAEEDEADNVLTATVSLSAGPSGLTDLP